MSTQSFAILEAERKQLEQTQAVLERLTSFRRPYDARRDAVHQQLVGYSEQRFFPDKKTKRSNVFVPYPFANVEQVRASIMQALFLLDPPFECLPRGARDSDAALAMQRVLEVMVLQRGRLRSVMNRYVGGLATYGFYPLYVGWDWDYDTIPTWQTGVVMPTAGTPPELIGQNPQTGEPLVMNPLTGQPLLQRQRIFQKVPRNRPLFETIDIYDLLIDPDKAYVARLFDKTFPQMVREQESASASGCQLYSEDALGKLETHLRQKPESERDSALIHIAELWDAVNGTCTLITAPEDPSALSYKDRRFAARSAQYSAWRRTTADAPKMLLSPTYPNPFLHCKVPILYTNYTELPGEPFGTGVIEPAAGMTEHLNNFVRAIEDNWNVGINQVFGFDAERNIDLEGLQMANVPGALVPLYPQGGPIDGVFKRLERFTPNGNDYSILPLFQQMIETSSGQSDFYSRGVGTPVGNETATGIQSVIQQASKRVVGVVQQLEEDILEPLLQMTASNIQQFISDEIEVRMTDERPAIGKINSQFAMIAPADLAGSFDFRLMGSLYMENRTVQQAHMLQLTQIIASNPGLAAFVKPYEGLQELLRVFRIPYPGRFLKTQEEVQAEQMAMMQQQLMLEKIRQNEGLAPDERQKPEAGGGKKPDNRSRNYAKPASNPGTSATRSEGQRGGLNELGLGGAGATTL